MASAAALAAAIGFLAIAAFQLALALGAPLGKGERGRSWLSLPLARSSNFASSSPWERFGWGPLAALLAVLSLVVALSPS